MPRKSKKNVVSEAAQGYLAESLNPPADPRRKIARAADVADEVGALTQYEVEVMVVLDLDAQNRVIEQREVHRGTATEVVTHPREVFRGAVRNGAVGVILVHNHPSGNPEPSLTDQDLTIRIREAGRILGIPLLDHVVVVRGGFRSIREMNGVWE